MKKHVNIPIFIPHEGCPFQCIFCNQKKISGTTSIMNIDKMKNIIEEHLKTLSKIGDIEIAFFGGSFTGIPFDKQNQYLCTAQEYIDKGLVKGIRMSTRPDYIDEKILDNLKKYKVKVIELGVQSLDNEVLSLAQRGYMEEQVYKASDLIKKYGFTLGIQTMIGLPGDSREKSIETAKKVVGINPKLVRIYPTLVVKDTYLEEMFNNGQYSPISLEYTVDLCSTLLDIYEEHSIDVIRIGLQTTETLNEDSDVLAGPFHPAIRQLIESRRIYKKICQEIEEKSLYKKNVLIITGDKKNLSNIIGQKRENINKLREKYNFSEIRVSEINSSPDIQL